VNGAGVRAEKVVAVATTTWKDYLFAGSLMVGQRDPVVGGSTTMQYFVLDHLGSVAVVTNSSGGLQSNGRLGYDAWGNRRWPSGSDGAPNGSPVPTPPTTRGFTGHEMIDSVGLINMNGRVYDPYIGRFMSADPVTETVFMMQVLNKYFYVGNNPLSYTDMTGYSYLGGRYVGGVYSPNQVPGQCYQSNGCPSSPGLFEQIIRVVAVIGATFVCGPICGAAANAAMVGIQGGDLRDMGDTFVLTLVTSIVMQGVGGQYNYPGTPPPSVVGVAIASGVIGGIQSLAQGDGFASGFLSAGIGSLAGPLTGGEFSASNLVVAAVLGGTAAAIAGGKFANGAITASFAYLASSAARAALDKRPQGQSVNPDWSQAPNLTPSQLEQWFITARAWLYDMNLITLDDLANYTVEGLWGAMNNMNPNDIVTRSLYADFVTFMSANSTNYTAIGGYSVYQDYVKILMPAGLPGMAANLPLSTPYDAMRYYLLHETGHYTIRGCNEVCADDFAHKWF
jgi:RHS repeat-associated protein